MTNMRIDDGDGAFDVAAETPPVKSTRTRVLPRAPLRVKTEQPTVHEAAHDKPRRTRRRSAIVSEDRFYIPQDEIPEGLSYEWKRFSLLGQEDPFYIAAMREQGWEPVDPARHPNWVPPGYKEPHIVKDGMILMERPVELTQEALAEQRTLAKRQVREAEQRLGMTPNNTLNRERPVLQKEWGRMVLQSEE